MINSVNKYEFERAFSDVRPNNFSYDGIQALFDWFEQYEEDTGEQVELDVIAICCDFSEYTLEEINDYYDRNYEDLDEAIEALNNETMVIPVNDTTVILQAF